MKKISKTELARRDEIVKKIEEANCLLEQAIETYNDRSKELWDEVVKAQESLNDALEEARSYAEDIAGEISEYMEDKSEKWQEGENGQRYQAWLDAYEQAELEEVDLETPEPAQSCDINIEVLTQLPTSIDEV